MSYREGEGGGRRKNGGGRGKDGSGGRREERRGSKCLFEVTRNIALMKKIHLE